MMELTFSDEKYPTYCFAETSPGLDRLNFVTKGNEYLHENLGNGSQESENQILYLPVYNVSFDDLEGPVVLRLEDSLRDSFILSSDGDKSNEFSNIPFDPLQVALSSIETKGLPKEIKLNAKEQSLDLSLDFTSVEEKYKLIESIVPKKSKEKCDSNTSELETGSKDTFTCDICSKRFEKPHQLYGHFQCHKNELSLPCKICNKNFDTHSKLTKHEKEEHMLYLIKCPQCPKTYLQKINLLDHIKKDHMGERKHACKFCDKSFFKETDLKLHIQIHFGLSNSICEICGMKFSNISNLNRHRRIHTGVKPYVCKICGKRFSQVNALEFHVGTHSTSSSFKCKLCPKQYKNIIAIKRHMKEQHSMSRQEIAELFKEFKKQIRCYYCKICGDSFPFASYLSHHEKKVHSSQSEHPCHHCEKTFTSIDEIKSHSCEPPEDSKMKTHNGDLACNSDTYVTDFELTNVNNLNRPVGPASEMQLECIGFIDDKGDCFYLNNGVGQLSPKVPDPSHATNTNELFGLSTTESEHTTSGKTRNRIPDAPPEVEAIDTLLPFTQMSEQGVQPFLSVDQHDCAQQFSSHCEPEAGGQSFTSVNCDLQNFENKCDGSGDMEHLPSEIKRCDDSKHFQRECASVILPPPNITATESNLQTCIAVSSYTNNEDEVKLTKESETRSQVINLLHKYLKENRTSNGFKCNICGKEFNKKCNFRQHLGTHDVMFHANECDLCGKTFAWKSTLNKHKQWHSSVGAVTELCQYCGKGYKHYQDLIKHIKNFHNKERPHKCSECSKSFFRGYDLKIHMRTHTKEKPYVCRMCGFRFTHVSQLIRHERKHTGEKPYKCPLCVKSFAQSGSWHYHLRSKHKAGGDIKLSHGNVNESEACITEASSKEWKGGDSSSTEKLESYLTDSSQSFTDENQLVKLLDPDN